MLKYKMVVLFILISFNMNSQPYTTSRLTIQSGGSINIIFNTLYDYNNGKTLTDRTRLDVYYIDTTAAGVPTGSNWKLSVKADDTQFRGISGNLPLSALEIEATHGGGPAANYLGFPIVLTDSETDIVTNGTQTDLVIPVRTSVLITYYCGTTTPLLGRPPDYYAVNLIFTLETE